MKPRKYDSTVARIAGNIASGMGDGKYDHRNHTWMAAAAVNLARAIIAEVERTEPPNEQD